MAKNDFFQTIINEILFSKVAKYPMISSFYLKPRFTKLEKIAIDSYSILKNKQTKILKSYFIYVFIKFKYYIIQSQLCCYNYLEM